MRLGLGLSWGLQRNPSADAPPPPPPGPFSPGDLFASGETGGWYDIQNLSAMTVGRDGSGGAPGIGGVVGRLIDQSGNGNDLVAYSDAARPLLQETVDGHRYLSFDGIDDHMRLDLAAPPQMSVMFAASGRQAGNNGRFLSISSEQDHDWGTEGHLLIYRKNGNVLAEKTLETIHNFGAYDTMRLYEVTADGTNVMVGNNEGSSSVAYVLNNAQFVFGARSKLPLQGFIDMDFFGCMLINRMLTVEERADLRQHYADLSGVSL
ncbi:MAG: hypothetical protein AAGA39_06405 [Pseudomonadota bacterium]